MDAWKKEELTAAGVDVEDALGRFMGNEALLNRFLKKFLDDVNYGKLTEAIAAGDTEGAITASHTLKGVSGNLSLTKLHELLTLQVAALRSGDWDKASAMMSEIGEAYEAVTAAIQRSV